MANNVRFVRTTKAKWLARDTYDQFALYFCEDTGEMFKGDQVYTDAIRVIPTKADLPSCPYAADGIIYYISETKSGYMMAPDRSGWLQTIYAPVTDAYVIPESEMYTTVTTVGAVRDIENKIYEYIDEKTSNVAPDESVSALEERVKNIEDDYLVGADKTELINDIKETYETKSDAELKLAEAKEYTDSKVKDIASNEAVGVMIDEAITEAKEYTDLKVKDIASNEAVGNMIDEAITEAKEYTDLKVKDIASNEAISDMIDEAIAEYSENHNIEVDKIKSDIENKADKATTLAGYNIADAYTKEEVNDIITNMASGVLYKEYIANNDEDSITIDILNNHIIKVDGYKYVTISLPESLGELPMWDCYFYIAFRNADAVALHLPENVRITGDRPSYALPGDLWEISINNQGGAVCVIHRYQASFDTEG